MSDSKENPKRERRRPATTRLTMKVSTSKVARWTIYVWKRKERDDWNYRRPPDADAEKRRVLQKEEDDDDVREQHQHQRQSGREKKRKGKVNNDAEENFV